MAGAKETPRQKMIGMMYLVLTALLALNVSKTILDAFVAIEENIQVASSNEYLRGEEKLAELQGTANDNTVLPKTREDARKLLKTIATIDQMTMQRISEIDALKIELLRSCGEDVSSVGTNESILLEKKSSRSLKPVRMNLDNVQNKEAYDEVMHLLVGEDIKRPTGKGMVVWKNYHQYRDQLTQLIAKSNLGQGGGYHFNLPRIQDFRDQKDLYAQIHKAIIASKVHPDDQEAIVKIYASLTKRERVKAHEIKQVHWIGKTFDHAPVVAAIASLSSLQKEILTARADAVSLIRQRVGSGEYSFNEIMPLAYGPEFINQGEEVEIQVLMAAYDSNKQPVITVNGGSLNKTSKGKGYITARGNSGDMKLYGTITVTNKSGIAKTLPWEKTVKVMKPQGTISLPGLNVLYRNYDNIVEGVASGYDETILSASDISLRKNGRQYVARPTGNGRTTNITIKGRNSKTGKTETLGTYPFRVMNLPRPSLFVGQFENGSTISVSDAKNLRVQNVKYPPEILLNANYSVVGWDLTVTGNGINKNVSGKGNQLTSAATLLNQVKPGNIITLTVNYKGPVGGNATCVLKVR